MEEVEREVKYLLKYVPKNLKECKSKRIIDIYIPRSSGHSAVRIRQQGDKFFITKKTPISDNELKEESIEITKEEFNILKEIPKAQIINKTRYFYPLTDHLIEIDIFTGKHDGLALAEVEFKDMKSLSEFTMPDFCLKEITSEGFLAGGVLCGKSYNEIENSLNKIGYKKII